MSTHEMSELKKRAGFEPGIVVQWNGGQGDKLRAQRTWTPHVARSVDRAVIVSGN